MSDREFGGNDDLSLPKGTRPAPFAPRRNTANSRAATVQKIVTEILQSEPGMTVAAGSRGLLIECCVEFITLISSEANEIAEKDAKKTIAAEHVQKALEELDFHDYVPAILEVEKDFKNQQKVGACTTGVWRLREHAMDRVFLGYAYRLLIDRVASAFHNCVKNLALIFLVESREETDQDRAERHDRRGAHPCTGGALPQCDQQVPLGTFVLNPCREQVDERVAASGVGGKMAWAMARRFTSKA